MVANHVPSIHDDCIFVVEDTRPSPVRVSLGLFFPKVRVFNIIGLHPISPLGLSFCCKGPRLSLNCCFSYAMDGSKREKKKGQP